MSRRRIAVVTGTRADFGLLSRLIALLRAAVEVELQVLVTGAHLSPAHGLTVREIEECGVPIDARVDLTLGEDTRLSTAHAIGRGTSGFADVYSRLRPDLVVVLGDRYEILAAVSAATVLQVPVAHLHGGELTLGAMDDAIRHAVTKLSHLHFVAAAEYRDRVVQLGESPDRVFLVGGLGVDVARHTPLFSRAELEAGTGFRFGRRNFVVTFHPETLAAEGGLPELEAMLAALGELPDDVHLVVTLPNADPGQSIVRQRLEAFAAARRGAWTSTSLGFRRYLSFLKESDGVIGNSSSGLIEAPAVGVGTVNIGSRQRGRLRAASVLDCGANPEEIGAAIARISSASFRASLHDVKNPYGDGGASERIAEVLRNVPLHGILQKPFHDLPAVELAGTVS